MCRHLAYLGPSVPLAEVLGVGRPHRPRGLYEQSWAPRSQRHGTVNADGFGVGWHPAGGPPARYRRAVPIWTDPDLPDLARCLTADSALAAVRSATPGTTFDARAVAPYRAGRWLFSLNGTVPAWTRLLADVTEDGAPPGPTELLTLEAHCDSALLWTLVRLRLRAGESMARALAGVARQVTALRPDARVNLLASDGRTVTATRRGETLWYRVGRSRARDGGREVWVASEPCDDRDGWRELPDPSLLVATRAGARVLPLSPPSTAPHPPSPAVERCRTS